MTYTKEVINRNKKREAFTLEIRIADCDRAKYVSFLKSSDMNNNVWLTDLADIIEKG